jgi:Flp pilus assembly pilin Flp
MKTMETVETKKAKHISRRFGRFVRANEAVAALEYAILVGVIAVAIGLALTTFSGQITAALKTIGDKVGGTTMAKTPKVN